MHVRRDCRILYHRPYKCKSINVCHEHRNLIGYATRNVTRDRHAVSRVSSKKMWGWEQNEIKP